MTIQYSHGKGRQLEVDINGVITKIAALGKMRNIVKSQFPLN